MPEGILKFLFSVNWNENEDAEEAVSMIKGFDDLKFE